MRYLQSGMISVVVFSLAACAYHTQSVAVGKTPSSGSSQNSMQSIARVIVYFQRPTSEGKEIFNAIAGACRCVPIFFGPYGSDALIYEITLPQGRTFAVFENELRQKSESLGIKNIEQDSILQHQ